MSYRRLQIPPADRRQLEAACRPRRLLQRRPQAVDAPRVERSTWTRTWHFPTEAAAEKWNAAWEEALAGETELPWPLLELDDRTPSRLYGVVARIVAGVLVEEIEAGNPYPRGVPGGRYDLVVEHLYEESALPGGRPGLLLHIDARTYRAGGELFWASDTVREYPLERLDAHVAETLGCARSRHLDRTP